jgi:hypothetical protein
MKMLLRPPTKKRFMRLLKEETQAHLQRRFENWRSFVSQWLFADRGRAQRLADHLGCSRQRISQWFVLHHRNAPGWVVMPTLEFIEREQTLPDVRHPVSPKTAENPAQEASFIRAHLGRAIDFAHSLKNV